MRLVILESPFAGDVARNVAYAKAAMQDCLAKGEAPLASHVLYAATGVLDDANVLQRDTGIRAGFCWAERADATVVYRDLGISRGMQLGLMHAEKLGRPVEYRSLPDWSPT
jgi:hypothetical protein